MTEFKRLSESVQSLEDALARAQEAPDAAAEAASMVLPLAAELSPSVARFKARALEPDPEKRMYGAAMCGKILDLASRFEAAAERAELLKPIAEEAEEKKRAAERALREQHERELAERAARLEADRRRTEEEALATAAAAKAEEGESAVRGGAGGTPAHAGERRTTTSVPPHPLHPHSRPPHTPPPARSDPCRRPAGRRGAVPRRAGAAPR
jgi:hypothetical protein